MNFTEREFSTVTDKLERYASQIGTLQAHLDTEKKLNGMMATLGDKEREILTLRHELAMESSRRQKSEEAVRAMEMEVQGRPEQIDALFEGLKRQKYINITGIEMSDIPVDPKSYEMKVKY